ncbi:MAG: hypothetical protein ACYS29_05460, partial [Planctomycetota bacterium]
MAFENFFLHTNFNMTCPDLIHGWQVFDGNMPEDFKPPVSFYQETLRKQGFVCTEYLTTLPLSTVALCAKYGEHRSLPLFRSLANLIKKERKRFIGGLMGDCSNGGEFDNFNEAYKWFSFAMDGYKDRRLFFVNSCNFAHHFSALM